MALLCSALGLPIENCLGILLMKAESISFCALVAPMTMIRPLDTNPSHNVMNSAFNMAATSWSVELASRKNESISSMNIIHGCNLLANEKMASTILLLSPYHLSIMVDMRIRRKNAPLSLAMAFANIVLPHPGGPCIAKRSGSVNGKITASRNSSMMSFKPPTSLNETLMSSGIINEFKSAFSYSVKLTFLRSGLMLWIFFNTPTLFFFASLDRIEESAPSLSMWLIK